MTQDYCDFFLHSFAKRSVCRAAHRSLIQRFTVINSLFSQIKNNVPFAFEFQQLVGNLRFQSFRRSDTTCLVAMMLIVASLSGCVPSHPPSGNENVPGIKNRKPIKIHPSLVRARSEAKKCNLGEIEANIGGGAYRIAIRNCSRAIQKYPDCSYAYWYRAMAWGCLGRPEKGVLDIETAMRLNPDEAGMRFTAAEIHEALGQWDRAVDDITQEQEISSQVYGEIEPGQWLVNRARNYAHLGRDELAMKDLKTYFDSGKENSEALYLRATISERYGHRREAIIDYRKAAEFLDAVPGGHPPGSGYGRLYENIQKSLKRLSD